MQLIIVLLSSRGQLSATVLPQRSPAIAIAFRHQSVAPPLEATTPSPVRGRRRRRPSSMPTAPHATPSLPTGPRHSREAAFHRRSWTLSRCLPVSLHRCLPSGVGEAIVPFPPPCRRFVVHMSESRRRPPSSIPPPSSCQRSSHRAVVTRAALVHF
jgi:hypothetical protein